MRTHPMRDRDTSISAYCRQLRLTALVVLWFGALLLVGLPARANDFDIRRVVADDETMTIYHDPVVTPQEVEMRVELDDGGCDVGEPTKNIRQAGDSFATMIVIDRGDPMAMGKWSKELLGGVGDYLRVELMAQRTVQDDYALLDSYGEPPPREQPLTNNQVAIERFLEDAPPPAAAGAAVYRRTLDGMKLIEATNKPLRAVMIISDGRDPNLYPGGVAEDTLLIEKSKQLGAPIFAVLVNREPRGKAHRAALQAAAKRLQSVCVRTGGAIVQEVRADDHLRSSLATALANFSRQVGSWQRTTCELCGDVEKGEVAVEMSAIEKDDDGDVVARSRKPYVANLSKIDDDLPSCEQCIEAKECKCDEDVKATCKDGKCKCEGDCKKDEDCDDGQVCKKGKCQDGPPWLLIGIGIGFLVFVVVTLLVIVQVALRVRANEARQREEEERRRRDDEAWKQREEDERRRREDEERQRQQEAQRQQMAAHAAAQAAVVAAAAPPAAPAPVLPPAVFRLHAKTSGYPDVALPDGATVIGGDAQEVQAAVAGLPPGTFGNPVVLSASTVSGKHAVVRVVQGAVTITDFGSTNGTFVNGVRIKANSIVELSAGDQIDLSKNVVYVLEPIAGSPVR
jgi:hypothetical protein